MYRARATAELFKYVRICAQWNEINPAAIKMCSREKDRNKNKI